MDRKEYYKQWVKDNKEKLKLWNKEYVKKNKLKLNNYKKEWARKHYIKSNRVLKTPEQLKFVQQRGNKEWRLRNKKYVFKQKKIYAFKNKDKIKLSAQKFNNKTNFDGKRFDVLKRDNWECQECGLNNAQSIVIYGMELNVHHKNKDKTNNDLTNLITLCIKCHSKVHVKLKRGFVE